MHERFWGLRADLERVGKQIPVQVARTHADLSLWPWNQYLQLDAHRQLHLSSDFGGLSVKNIAGPINEGGRHQALNQRYATVE
ncbi:hypothetical protein [Pseudomonas sp. B21-048]|uniref:hypothetical protein n=1 Tax=Pseudomonas sp. B21-048 TaxID=2895490 RepID=UPI00215E0E0C|nr:hypothetical protein [Pseudomonas sp. B21-048]UVL00667.1 hypothetical protein LOY56_10025 [Pseudomonas sp. B21-048]